MIELPDGARLHAEIAGNGPDVLLVSGLNGQASFWRPAVAALGGDARAISFDQRGIGQSSRGTQPVSIETLANDAWHLLDEVGVGAAPVLIGHSTGGAIVQAMAHQQPGRARSLVISGSWAGPNRYMQTLFRSRIELLALSPEAYASQGMFLCYPPAWLDENWALYNDALNRAPDDEEAQTVIRERIAALFGHDMRDGLPALQVPALILGATDDLIVPSFLQDELAQLLPDAKRHEFSWGGHFYPIVRAAEFARKVQAWIG